MTDRQGLLATIIAHPDDDLPRLVYADWLEEHGSAPDRARAAFIRLQIEAEALPEYDDRRDDLLAAAGRLGADHARDWSAGYPGRWGADWWCRRGFLRHTLVDPGDLPNPGLDALLAAEPVESFFFREPDGRAVPAGFADWPHLGRARELWGGYRRPALKPVLRSPRLSRLRVLRGYSVLDADDAHYLAAEPRFAGLECLEAGSCGLNDAAVAAVAASPVLARLTGLRYGSDRTTPAALRAVADSPLAGRLTELAASGPEHGAPGGRALVPLLRPFAALRKLDLHMQRVGSAGARALARLPNLAGLREVGLGNNDLGPRGVLALVDSPHLTGLESLDLSWNPPAGPWLDAVLAGPWRPRELGLVRNRLGAAAAGRLAAAPALSGLRRLRLDGNPLGDAGAEALARSEHLTGLRHLSLSDCRIGDAGARALAGAFPRLREPGALDLMGNRYGPDTAVRLRERFGYDPAAYS